MPGDEKTFTAINWLDIQPSWEKAVIVGFRPSEAQIIL
jgi:hypothetical protein